MSACCVKSGWVRDAHVQRDGYLMKMRIKGVNARDHLRVSAFSKFDQQEGRKEDFDQITL